MAGEFGEHGVADVHIDDDDRLCAGAAPHEFVRVEGVVGVHVHTRDAVEQGNASRSGSIMSSNTLGIATSGRSVRSCWVSMRVMVPL